MPPESEVMPRLDVETYCRPLAEVEDAIRRYPAVPVAIPAMVFAPVKYARKVEVPVPETFPLNVVQSVAERVPVAVPEEFGMLRVMLFVEVEMYQLEPVVEVEMERMERRFEEEVRKELEAFTRFAHCVVEAARGMV